MPAPPASEGQDPTAAVADLFARHERAFLAFSGGKDSLTVAHLCEPWRDRLTLLWCNTGYMAPHMAEFVRSYGDRFNLIELHPARPMPENWEEHGTPVDLLPVWHAAGVGHRSPRLRAWPLCCFEHRTQPILDFLSCQTEPCAFLTGQRASDKGATVEGLTERLPAHIEVVQPLWPWSDAEVLAFVATAGIQLQPHHHECATSVECIVCPANLSAEKMRFLDRHHPEQAQFIRATALRNLAIAGEIAREIVAALKPELEPAA